MKELDEIESNNILTDTLKNGKSSEAAYTSNPDKNQSDSIPNGLFQIPQILRILGLGGVLGGVVEDA